MRTYIGVNSSKRRVLLVVLKPAEEAALGILSNGLGLAASWVMGMENKAASRGGESTGGSAFNTFVEDMESSFTESMRSEQLTNDHLLRPLVQPVPTYPPLAPLDSLLDPYFVWDLQETFHGDVQSRLQSLQSSLLEELAALEKTCARLMTLLRPFLIRSAIVAPALPGKAPAFVQFMAEGCGELPVDHSSDQVSQSSDVCIEKASPDSSKLLILRARRSYFRDQKDNFKPAGENSNALVQHATEVQGVIQRILSELQLMCEELGDQMAATLRELVSSRKRDIERFRDDLVRSLATRSIVSAEDQVLWRTFTEQFRVASESDPIIIDFRVCHFVAILFILCAKYIIFSLLAYP